MNFKIKKIIFFFLGIFILFVIYYFSQDRTKLFALTFENKDTNTKYEFSETNHLKIISSPTKIIEYEIDENNLRITKRVNGNILEKYSWLGEGKLHLVVDENSQVLRQYLYKNKYESIPYGMLVKGIEFTFIYNKMRSLKLVFNVNKEIVKVLNYDSKGLIIKDSNPNLKVDFSYAGGIYDFDSKLLFFTEGVYNPNIGKWISKVKNKDIIRNLKELNNLKINEVYTCSATLDIYYHSYLCAKNQCGGLYATDYLNYFNGNGFVIDNSSYFSHELCKPIILSDKYDKNKFSNCINQKIQPRKVAIFDLFKHNCHHEVKSILNTCFKKATKKEYYVK